MGNRDTVFENTLHKYVNGLPLEGVFRGFSEWAQGVSVSIDTDNEGNKNLIWTIANPEDGSERKVTSGTSYGRIIHTTAQDRPYFDMVPTAVTEDDMDDD